MDIFQHENLTVYLLDRSIPCSCEGCEPRSSSEDFTCVLFENDVWVEHLDFSNALRRLKSLNPHISTTESNILNSVKECLKGKVKTKEFTALNSTLCLSFENVIDDVRLIWRLEALKAPVLQHLVTPLRMALEESVRQQFSILETVKKLGRAYAAGKLERNALGDKIMQSVSTHEVILKPVSTSGNSITKQPGCLTLSDQALRLFAEAVQAVFRTQSSQSSYPNANCTPSQPVTLLDAEDIEERRRGELQRKLARELEKAKSKRNKRSGILRK
ncbi:hypothetical protein PHET_06311 [Paragonimus heterotremus]|uniref:XLF-like N-terminal domain-containing protein n=1 Tax=Paragonimus heterotremus TaxID=100268 RepID=A0A8J4SZ03_9TREM|nr:hypothetical protein PHET_06311 [Paragonimus heterotremus]